MTEHAPEDGATLTERIKAVIEREVYCVVVVRSEHDSGCPGGGDYCSHHCPVPVQDYGDIGELAGAIARDLSQVVADALLAAADEMQTDLQVSEFDGAVLWLKTRAERYLRDGQVDS